MKLAALLFSLFLVGTLAQRPRGLQTGGNVGGGQGQGGGNGGGGGGGNGGNGGGGGSGGNGGGGGGNGGGGGGGGGNGGGGGGDGNGGGNGGGGGGGGGGNGGGGNGGNGGGGPVMDNVDPVIEQRFTLENDEIDGSAPYEMIAVVTDINPLRFVRFEVTDPAENSVFYQAVQTQGTDDFTATVFFGLNGTYTSRVRARDAAGNEAFTDTITFTVLGIQPPASVAEILSLANTRIRQTIAENNRIAATYLRLGFHDCVPNAADGVGGGCDGCLNLSNDANNGLLPAVQALAPIVNELEDEVLGVSRADLWAYATLVAAEVSQNTHVFTDSFTIGRQNCEIVGTCISTDPDFCTTNGPDESGDFPSNDLTTHGLITFMDEHFGFDADETVAIMGAHTLGRALPQNSGIQGQRGWVNDVFALGKFLHFSKRLNALSISNVLST
jgi:hypothetical protein